MSVKDVEDKMWELHDVNQTLKKQQLRLEQRLKKAQCEASYFKKKANKTQNSNKMPKTTKTKTPKTLHTQPLPPPPPNVNKPRARSNKVKTTTTTKRNEEDIASILFEIRDNIENTQELRHFTDEVTLKHVREELTQKQCQIHALSQKYDQLHSNLSADQIMKRRALEQCEKYKSALHQAEEREAHLQNELFEFERIRHENESLNVYVKHIKSENTSLKQRIDKLTQNSLFGDEMESNRVAQLTRTYNDKVRELQSSLSGCTEQRDAAQTELQQLHTSKQELQQNVARLQSHNEELQKRARLFERESGIDVADLETALQLIEHAKTNGDDLGFLQHLELDKCVDPILLKAKIDELQIKNHDLVLECTQNQNLLEMQINLNKKMEKDYHDLEAEYAQLKHDRNSLANEMQRVARNQSVSADAFFTAAQLQSINYESTENLIVLKIIGAHFDVDYFDTHHHGDRNPLTMLIVDFFEFESIRSKLCGGCEPKYELVCPYKVKMDAFLLHCLKQNTLSIDIVYKHQQQQQDKLSIIATSTVSLSNLLVTPDSCIQNEVEFHCSRTNQLIGTVSFIAKMLRSIQKL
mmetsp:Transcript_44265/g.73197  ORF Transcript_44265/g.73197 Transcript_44265/m.73197 type:complete len:581 (+) Transcript_44265:864-2606(+)